MIFIKVNSKNEVVYRHYHPFDSVDGLGKTQAELEVEGILVSLIPVPQSQPNKQEILKYNTATKQLYYEYVDIPQQPPTTEERLITLENALLKSQGVI